PEGVFGEVVLGLAATAAWLLLVRWRVSRQPPMIWRAMVLSCGGVVLAWFLLMTLWLPMFNERNTYRGVSAELRAAFDENDARAGDCVVTDNVDRAARASFHYFAKLPFARAGTRCRWLLVQEDGPAAYGEPDVRPGWTLRWEGRRRRGRDERFVLFERTGNATTGAEGIRRPER